MSVVSQGYFRLVSPIGLAEGNVVFVYCRSLPVESTVSDESWRCGTLLTRLVVFKLGSRAPA